MKINEITREGFDDIGQKIYKGNTTRVVHSPVANKNISVVDQRIDKFASDRARDDLTYKGAKITMPGTNQAIAKAQNNIKQAYNKQDKIDQRSGAGTSYITKGKPIKFGNNNSNIKIAMDSIKTNEITTGTVMPKVNVANPDAIRANNKAMGYKEKVITTKAFDKARNQQLDKQASQDVRQGKDMSTTFKFKPNNTNFSTNIQAPVIKKPRA